MAGEDPDKVPALLALTMLSDAHFDPLAYAAIEATEEAILNSMLAVAVDARARREHRPRAAAGAPASRCSITTVCAAEPRRGSHANIGA